MSTTTTVDSPPTSPAHSPWKRIVGRIHSHHLSRKSSRKSHGAATSGTVGGVVGGGGDLDSAGSPRALGSGHHSATDSSLSLDRSIGSATSPALSALSMQSDYFGRHALASSSSAAPAQPLSPPLPSHDPFFSSSSTALGTSSPALSQSGYLHSPPLHSAGVFPLHSPAYSNRTSGSPGAQSHGHGSTANFALAASTGSSNPASPSGRPDKYRSLSKSHRETPRKGDSPTAAAASSRQVSNPASSGTSSSSGGGAARFLRRVASAPNTKAFFSGGFFGGGGGSSSHHNTAGGGSSSAAQSHGLPPPVPALPSNGELHDSGVSFSSSTPQSLSSSASPQPAQAGLDHHRRGGAPLQQNTSIESDGSAGTTKSSASSARGGAAGGSKPKRRVPATVTSALKATDFASPPMASRSISSPQISQFASGGGGSGGYQAAPLAGLSTSPSSNLLAPPSPAIGAVSMNNGGLAGSPRASFRRTYSSSSIKVRDREVGPSSFQKVRMLGKGDVGKVYLVREKQTHKLYAMKVLSKKEMIKRNKIKRALAEEVRLFMLDPMPSSAPDTGPHLFAIHRKSSPGRITHSSSPCIILSNLTTICISVRCRSIPSAEHVCR